jgi:hypothetical protein
MSLDPERVGELAEALAKHRLHASINICTGCKWRATVNAGSLTEQHEAHLAADVIAPLVAGWLAEAEERGAAKVRFDRARHFEQGREAGAAEVRARVEAALNEWEAADRYAQEVTSLPPEFAVVSAVLSDIRAALATNPEEQP